MLYPCVTTSPSCVSMYAYQHMKHSRKLTQSICWCLSSLSLHLACVLTVDPSEVLWEASHLWHFMLWKVVWLIIRTHLIVSAVLLLSFINGLMLDDQRIVSECVYVSLHYVCASVCDIAVDWKQSFTYNQASLLLLT